MTHTGTMHRTYLALAVIAVSGSAFGQAGEDWNSPFPTQPATQPTKPPATQPAAQPKAQPTQPATQPAAQPAQPRPSSMPTRSAPPAAQPAQPAATPEAKAKVEERLRAAKGEPPATDAKSAGAAAAAEASPDDKLPVVSKRERFVPGTEPHSPSTWGNAFDDARNSRVTVGQVGLAGGVLLPSARMGPKGIVRVSLLGEYLNINQFPVKNSADIRSAVTFAGSFQPFEWGEIFVAYSAAANTNNRTAPNLIQALGDLTLGVKASREWVRGLWAGADVRLLTFSGVGNQGIDHFAVGVRPMIMATWDVRSVAPKFPLLASLGLGFTFDSTAGLVQQQKLNASEEFALSVNRYHRFNFGVGVEVPFPVVTPYLEYNLAAPLGVKDGQLTGPDGVAVPVSAAMAQTLGLGLKVTAIKDLTLGLGFNFGLARSVGLGVPATPPWNMHVAASFAIDPYQRGDSRISEIVREKKVEQKVVEPPKTAKIEGTVVDAATKKPLQGVVLAAGAAPPSATDASGRFLTVELSDLKLKLVASREGYKNVEQDVALEAGKTAKVELALEPDEKKAIFEITTASAKKPVAAEVKLDGKVQQSVTTTATAEPTKAEVPASQYTVTVNAEGFLSQTREVQVAPGGTMKLAFELVPAPKTPLVVFKGDKIEILQQVHFLTGKSTILADSFNLLQQVVDVVIKNSVKKVKVEGHTDNRGDKKANQKLSEDRARAVIDYMIAQGVSASRLESVGYGDSKPVAPNLTARGRELNRRVEFLVEK